MSEIVERAVAAAKAELRRQADADPGCLWVGDGSSEVIDGEVEFGPLVRAVIVALREPTEVMMNAAEPAFRHVNSMLGVAHAHGQQLQWDDGKPPLWFAWQAMIDKILE